MMRIVVCALIVSCTKKEPHASVDAGPKDAKRSGLGGTASPTAAQIPTADLTSQASSPWTPGPKVAVSSESVDGEALRVRTRARLARDIRPVSVLRGTSALELGSKACEAAVPHKPADTPILIKPNIGGFDWFKDPAKNGGDNGVTGRTTDPEFVRGIIRCLRSRGHTKITVAEGWGATHADWEKLVRVSGYAEMAAAEHVPLVALDDDGVFDVEGAQPGKPLTIRGMDRTTVPTLLMPKLLAEHLANGLYISAPKIKNHRYAVASVGIKGTQGTIMYSDASPAFRQKGRTHREISAALAAIKKNEPGALAQYVKSLELFGERIADVLEVEAPDVVLAEGAPMMRGDGFQKLIPGDEMIAVAGTNVVRVDRVALELLGVWDVPALANDLGGHATSPLLTIAAKRFGISLETRPDVVGDGKDLLDKPRTTEFYSMAGFEIHERGAATKNESIKGRIVAKHAGQPIVIDGRDSDPSWKDAQEISFDTDWLGRKTPHKTSVRLLWNKEALFAMWSIQNTELFVDRSKDIRVERAKLYSEDCVELFFGLSMSDKKSYAEVEVGPYGHFLDLWVKDGKGDVAWSSETEIKTVVEAKSATIEMAIRSPQVVSRLVPHAAIPIAFYRMEGRENRQYLAWQPTMTPKPNFHVPERFGECQIEP